MSGRLPTTPEKVNACSCGVATLAGIKKVASCELIKKDYIIEEVPGPLLTEAANIVNQYESKDVFRDKSIYTVPTE